MRQLRVRRQQLGKGCDQADVVLAWLQIAHGKYERRFKAQPRPRDGSGALPSYLAEFGIGGVRHHADLSGSMSYSRRISSRENSLTVIIFAARRTVSATV